MEIFFFLFIIFLIAYWMWEILVMGLLLYLIVWGAKAIYRWNHKHAVLCMYLWIAYSGFIFLLLCIPITHVRWFEYEESWIEKLYNINYLSKIDADSEEYTTLILDKKLFECEKMPTSERYNLYNRLTSQDANHLYLDFFVGMPAYTFYNKNKKEESEDYYNYAFIYGTDIDKKLKKYELLDGIDYTCDGIFINKKLEGIALHNTNNYLTDAFYQTEELSKRFLEKFGEPHSIFKDSTEIIIKWLFNDKHIIIAATSIDKNNYNKYNYHYKNNFFSGIIIYNPHTIIPLIYKKESIRKKAELAAMEQEKRVREDEKKALLKQQEERKNARQKEIADSIATLENKKNIQNGF